MGAVAPTQLYMGPPLAAPCPVAAPGISNRVFKGIHFAKNITVLSKFVSILPKFITVLPKNFLFCQIIGIHVNTGEDPWRHLTWA